MSTQNISPVTAPLYPSPNSFHNRSVSCPANLLPGTAARSKIDSESSNINAKPTNVGSLLRLFQSGFFNSWIGLSYLYRFQESIGVLDYLCNELYKLPDDDIEFYLVQICNLLIYKDVKSNALERFILDKCSASIHFALQVSWIIQYTLDYSAHSETLRDKCLRLREECEIAAVNCRRISQTPLRPMSSNPENVRGESETPTPLRASTGNMITEDSLAFALSKKDRSKYFDGVVSFVEECKALSLRLKTFPPINRQEQLEKEIEKFNDSLPSGLHIPLWAASESNHSIVRLPSKDTKVLDSRERVPFILTLEVVDDKKGVPPPDMDQMNIYRENVHKKISDIERLLKKVKPNSKSTLSSAIENIAEYQGNCVSAFTLFDQWEQKKNRIRKESPFGDDPNWDLRSVIFKYGDDCKQEQLGLQLITQFQKIFQEANLPIFLRPYRILVISSMSGFIETVTDSISLHQLKKTTKCNSLFEYFQKAFPDPRSLKIAQRNFAESVAGYSIVCYLLQIKDRHNGNILMDKEGHILHIDFGFMLSNSPGSINFESSPFKLTDEFVEVMNGNDSNFYQYFKALCILGFLEVRKQLDKIVDLVDMNFSCGGSKLPCFYAGQAAVDALRERFVSGLPEIECFEHVESLIAQSRGNWRTNAYDNFQFYSNGILP